MPANVTVEFEKARIKYEQANSPEAKLEALIEMQRFAPGHKGAENLRADITKKIALVKREIEKHKQREKKKGSAPSFNVKKEGIGQIALVGLPNSGKSTLLGLLSNADVQISSYPFTTRKPVVGMMDYKRARVQLVEVPALVKGSSAGKANGTQMLSVIRNADAIVLVARNRGEESILADELRKANIRVNEEKPKIRIEHSQFKGITIAGKKLLKLPRKEFDSFLKSIGYPNASVTLEEEVMSLNRVMQALDESVDYKRAITVNVFAETNAEALKQAVFDLLGLILVYTKKPGEKADLSEPLALKKGSAVAAAAEHLHKDIGKRMRFARVWGSAKFPGQKVSKDFRLKNLDIVEIY